MRTAIPLTVLATALACSLASAPAHARARVFVASYGNDSNPCTFLSPCKTFQQAVNVVAAGGEVTAIDSAGFGPITINKSVSITSPAGIEAGIVPTSGGSAITITAGTSDAVQLRGLTVDGAGVAGLNGIWMQSGGSLEVVNCLVRNFNTGILIFPSNPVTFLIEDTNASQNANTGIDIAANGDIDGTVNRSTMDNNGAGFLLLGEGSSGTAKVSIVDSVASNNTNEGFHAFGGGTKVVLALRNVTASNNATGIDGDASGGPATIRLAHSFVTENATGVAQLFSSIVFSYGDNYIDGNTTDVDGSLSSETQR